MQEEIIELILDEAFHVHSTIGPGMVENAYKTRLAYRLKTREVSIEIEKVIPVFFERIKNGVRLTYAMG